MLSFRTQLAIVVLASVAMLGLAAVLIRDVISRTETRLVAEARQQVTAACRELLVQYEERAAFATDDPLEQLPLEAEDLSLRGLSAAVLRSYEGVTGGFYLLGRGQVVGRSSPVQLTGELRDLIGGASSEAVASGGLTTRTEDLLDDVMVIGAVPRESGAVVAWAVKRLAGVRDPVVEQRRWLLAALVFSTLLGMGAVVSVWFSLQSGVTGIRQGLSTLGHDFHYRLPEPRGEFGPISSAINRMTAHRLDLETELRRQDRLAALGKAVAGVAHEVRNPLNSMKLTLELLKRRLAKGTATVDEVNGAIQEVDRLDQIVGRLLAFGQPALSDRRMQLIRPLVEQAILMVQEPARRKGVEIRSKISGDLTADIDGPQIQQVMMNLLLNAIDASPAGGGVIQVLAGEARNGVSITVADQGLGIPPDDQPHVFDLYFTTKPEGVGLGLSVSREIVVSHGGKLDFESGHEGTKFRLLLPAGRDRQVETQRIRFSS